MICFPNAKINIGLDIVEKRKDNFHNIETLFYPIGLADILEVNENFTPKKLKNYVENERGISRRNSFKSTGINIPGNSKENLCLKAYELIKKDYSVPPVKIHLHKIIPIGAGLGGGSSDAAHFIHLLENLFSLKIPVKQKLNYALQLGSDCSFFIKNKAAFAKGRGEKLESAIFSLYGFYLVLICPPIHVSTKDAYSDVKPRKPNKPLKELLKMPVSEWKKNIFNQFEETVFKKFPGIEKIKIQLYNEGAIYSSMSGSGSSVFGLFDCLPDEKKLKKKFFDGFIWVEKL